MDQLLLDRNENQYGPAPECYHVLRSAGLEQLSFYSRAYAKGTKSELSERLSQILGIPEPRVLLSYGSEDMLKQVVHCYLRPGETILLPRQSWWYYKSVAKEVYGKEVTYPLHEQHDRFVYDLNEIVALYESHHPQVILIASPNNPTGNSIDIDTLNKLVDHCKSSVIVLDEAYYGFSSSSNGHLEALLKAHKRIIVLRTFSKYYALAGLRIGYACVGEALEQLVTFSARYLGYNQLSEKVALAALTAPEYYERITHAMRKDKEMYFQAFSRLDGFSPFRSDANFILVRYPRDQKAELKKGLLERNVVVKFVDDPGLEDCVRITIGTQEQNARTMQAFREVAKTLQPASTVSSAAENK